MKLISARAAQIGSIVILSGIIIVHLLILTGNFPAGIVWGGRVEDHAHLVKLETISIAINSVMLLVVLMSNSNIFGGRTIGILLWIMFVFFIFNTVGNLSSIDNTEQLVFAPFTLLLALFSLRLALHQRRTPKDVIA
ncbi:MAG: hypothetical protein M3R08_04860 [Bacteroidota bacterium]|nr:hypothetical protein [Bacteroidota bacterium]